MTKTYSHYLRGYTIKQGTRYWFTDTVTATTHKELKQLVKQYRKDKKSLNPTYTKELEYSYKKDIGDIFLDNETVEIISSMNMPQNVSADRILFWL
jgi:hypothetical protein